MPYIVQKQRELFEDEIVEMPFPTCAGDLNYIITRLCLKYLEAHGTNYQKINDVVGVLSCAQMEFYRKLAAPYEEGKISTNGDVYPSASTIP